MNKKNTDKQNTHYATLRRNYRDNKPIVEKEGIIYLYGVHTVIAAINNPKRHIKKLLLTQNAYKKVESLLVNKKITFEIVTIKNLNLILGAEAVHQGIVAIAKPLKINKNEAFADKNLIVLLDQITDPHNVGAIMRNCVALNVETIIATQRHSPKETSVLAKSASGAFDLIDFVYVKNLANTLQDLNDLGFITIGLDSKGSTDLFEFYAKNKFEKIVLVLGAEGKGLREKTRQTVNKLARLDMPGEIKSLNVSNASAIALYLTYKNLN